VDGLINLVVGSFDLALKVGLAQVKIRPSILLYTASATAKRFSSTPKLSDRRPGRAPAATVALKSSRTVQQPSGAAVRCGALVRRRVFH